MSITKGPYPAQQQIYCLSFTANSAFGLSMSSLADLQNYVDEVTQQVLTGASTQAYIGADWVSVWGTRVYSNSPNNASVVVDNAMGLFYSASQNLFVVAIAGTNGNSGYDWFSENFKMNSTVLWQDVLGTGGVTIPSPYQAAAIATGFATGLDILANKMVDADGHTMLQALNAYLITNKTVGATLAVTGHSLGGALCPVLALYIYQLQQNSELNWNTSNGVAVVAAYPTAGPTAGETNFANYYASLVAASDGAFTYLSQYNTNDVVPQAWMLSTMESVPALYDANLTPAAAPFMGPLVLGMMSDTVVSGNYRAIGYAQIEPRTKLTMGFDEDTQFETLIVVGDYLDPFSNSSLYSNSPQVTSVACFIAQMLYQHTEAYSGSSTVDGLLVIGGFIGEYGDIKEQVSGGISLATQRRQVLAAALGKYVKGISPEAFIPFAKVAHA
jgi:Lipase (class 3)